MPNATRPSPSRRSTDRWLPPVPHPSWAGEAALSDLAQPLRAADFWQRLGL